MADGKTRWDFYGFQSKADGRPAQSWYNALIPDAQDEVFNLVAHLAALPGGRWRRPEYDPLEGEGGISELRPLDIRSPDGNVTYRIYGIRGYPDKRSYTFLHATDKDAKNDEFGKAIAKHRLHKLERGEASAHAFDFEGRPASAVIAE